MIKVSNKLLAVWDKLYDLLSSPKSGPYSPPPKSKIILDVGRLPEESQAIGHVSSEEASEGIIHLHLGRLEEALRERGVPLEKLPNLDSFTKDELENIISAFAESLGHESGHIRDFDKNSPENPFPGGESVADAAGRAAVSQTSIATNILNKFDKLGRLNMKRETLKILNKLAEDLDKLGAIKVADEVENMMSSIDELQPGVHLNPNLVEPIRYKITNYDKEFIANLGLEPGSDQSNVKAIQEELKEMGYNVGAIDGVWGPKSQGAWDIFLKDVNEKLPTKALKGGYLDKLNSGNIKDVMSTMKYLGDPDLNPNFAPGFVGSPIDLRSDVDAMEISPLPPVPGPVASRPADDGATNIAAKLTVEEKIEKIASDTEKYKEVFWHKPTTPFGR
jgi:hypothetical protein